VDPKIAVMARYCVSLRRLGWLLDALIIVDDANNAIKARKKFESTRDLCVARPLPSPPTAGLPQPIMPAKPKSEGVRDGRPACISTALIRDIRRAPEFALSRRGAVLRDLVYRSNQKR
jgi:hypothetical protein